MSPQPQYHDGGWVTSSRFAYQPNERLYQAHEVNPCPTCEHWKLIEEEVCNVCALRALVMPPIDMV